MRCLLIGFAIAFIVQAGPVTAGDAPAQGQVPLLEAPSATFRSSVELVTLNVTALDGKDHHVGGLGRDDFLVFEDGVAQDLSYFEAVNVPLDVALLVDSSSSMIDKLEQVQQAALGFVSALRPGDRAAVMGFTSQLRVLQPFTSDHAALEQAVQNVKLRGTTALYTSIYIALDQFKRQQAATVGIRRPAIIVITDGEDTASMIRFEDLIERARRAGVAIYPVAIRDHSESARYLEAEARLATQWDYSLKTLARETGGRAFFPVQLTELAGVYKSVADELATQYALGFVPKGARADGRFRRLMVRVPSRPEVRLRTRAGYYAPGPAQAANTTR